jgi:MaoC dehydratase-like protein
VSKSVFFEDLRLGDVRALGSYTFHKAEMIDFARRFDPHPFHVDEAAGEESFFGGLVASGVHTFAAFSRLMYDGLLVDVAMSAGAGCASSDYARRSGRARRFTAARRSSGSSPRPDATIRAPSRSPARRTTTSSGSCSRW